MTGLGSRSGKLPRRAGASLKTAAVTGGASGIGRAVAERLRSDGFQVAVIDLSPTDDEFGHVADVTDRAQVDTAVASIREKFGPILVLVNAAGVEGFQKFSKMTFPEWSKVIDVNLNGVFHTIQSVLPDMVEAGWGRIVNISSSSTHSGQPFMAHYVAAKSAVNGLTKSLALEYGPSGITVNAVPPGFVDTPMLRSAERRHLLGGTVEDHINRTPVRRVGRPEDIAAACAFFVSDEASYITGQILGVNGGRNT
ncbi:MAG: 2-hydroxycyclohexanecarboxyl-CoA dehydrogenase [Mycobacterium sp.]|jgi:2-hydroxycyclohexanecarboxyl-CoA dehydrogenase|nr:2-hydroxycyclohexanecarboxyl-CoA dehydrogenase [Mycobacterium sp.]